MGRLIGMQPKPADKPKEAAAPAAVSDTAKPAAAKKTTRKRTAAK